MKDIENMKEGEKQFEAETLKMKSNMTTLLAFNVLIFWQRINNTYFIHKRKEYRRDTHIYNKKKFSLSSRQGSVFHFGTLNQNLLHTF